MAVSKVVSKKATEKVPRSPKVKKLTEQDNSFSNRIVILFSAPLLDEDLSPVEKLSIHEEVKAIATVLEEIPHPISVEIVVKVATSQTLQDVLSHRVKPLIIHFIGHGTKQEDGTALVLEDEVGMARCLSEEELDIALSNCKEPPCQLALLNACHSEKLAQAFVKAGVPHVIGVNAEDKILDIAARSFSRRLYQGLFNEDTVVNSFLLSRNAVKLDDKLRKLFNSKTFQQGVNFDEAFKFRLLPQDSHERSLTIEPADTHQVIYPQWSNTNIPSQDPNFVGRRQEIHQVIKVLVESDKRCIALHGMGGIGKTALAYAIGRWLHERDHAQDGVWFISLRDTDSVGTLITKVKQSLELRSFALEKELNNRRMFLILDDLDKLIEKECNELVELLNSLLEQCSNLRLLLTARDSLVRDIVYCHQQEVCSMGASETREIFRKYAPPQEKWGDDELASNFNLLVKFLDGYPLPIKLAASYMAETECTLKMLCEDLDIEPMSILDSYTSEQRKERSLRITLERSFEMLSPEARDIFPLMAYFPGGLSRELARSVWGRRGNQSLTELFKFSMAEKSSTASDWRVTLPEPARTYAESKLQKGREIDYLAPLVLDYYHENFCEVVIKLFTVGDENKGRQMLLQESSNIIKFLEWGLEHEKSSKKICCSARITASLSPYWRWIEANKDPLGRLEGALATAKRNQDIAAEGLVMNAINQVKSQFLATTSHELRNPLNIIINCIRLVRDGMCDDREEEMEFLKKADDTAIHLLGVINDLLDISKIEAGKLSVSLEIIDLQVVLKEVVNIQSVNIQQKGLQLNIPQMNEPLIVNADAAKLKQVLINIIGNATKFTYEGSITITKEIQLINNKSYVIIKVKDTGVGIDPAHQEQLFRPFVMVEGGNSRKFGGIGLGLAISRNLIELMNGTITLESTGINQGTTIIITLPLID